MILHRRILLDVEGPVFTRSNVTGGFGVDAPVARLPDRRPYLPGTLIVGRLAEAYRQLGEAERATGRVSGFLKDLEHLFASGSGDFGEGDEIYGRNDRRKIFVSDAIAPAPSIDDRIRTRIAIDPETGSVAAGALQVIETPHAVGEKVRFEADVRILAPADDHDGIQSRLSIALRWISQWGGLRSVGFGKSIESILETPTAIRSVAAPSAISDLLPFRLAFNDPVCVGERRVSPNIYESGSTIPGGTIKGALASLILSSAGLATGATLSVESAKVPESLRALARHFSLLRVLHGVPAPAASTAGARPRRAPHSIVSVKTKEGVELFDLALAPDANAPCLIHGQAPVYQPDRKQAVSELVNVLTGWTEPSRELRVRTQIDRDRRSAMESRLFGVTYLRHDTHVWRSAFDLSAIPETDRPAVIDGLALALSTGLPGVGRGKSFATVDFESDAGMAPKPHADGRVIVVLQTPALLRAPEAGIAGDVHNAYVSAFQQIAPDLVLESIFVRERLAGAEFMANRLPDGLGYRPFLLTEAGSTFVFKAGDDAGRETAARWARRGLPIPESALRFYGVDPGNSEIWRYVPFLPENGYGEVWLRGPVENDENWAQTPRQPVWTPVAALEEALG